MAKSAPLLTNNYGALATLQALLLILLSEGPRAPPSKGFTQELKLVNSRLSYNFRLKVGLWGVAQVGLHHGMPFGEKGGDVFIFHGRYDDAVFAVLPIHRRGDFVVCG